MPVPVLLLLQFISTNFNHLFSLKAAGISHVVPDFSLMVSDSDSSRTTLSFAGVSWQKTVPERIVDRAIVIILFMAG